LRTPPARWTSKAGLYKRRHGGETSKQQLSFAIEQGKAPSSMNDHSFLSLSTLPMLSSHSIRVTRFIKANSLVRVFGFLYFIFMNIIIIYYLISRVF